MGVDPIEQVRTAVRELSERAQGDPGLRERLRTDPAGTLRAAELPEDAVAEYAGSLQRGGDDVAGYLADPCGRYYTQESPCLGGSRYTA